MAPSSALGRFRLESHDHNGGFLADLPYRDLQGEWQLTDKGQALRVNIPYRNYSRVSRANLAEGKTELWLYDTNISSADPIFAGPVWDITASSSEGVLAVSAQDPSSYLAKRLLRISKIYSNNTAVAKIADLMTYVNSVRSTNMTTNIAKVNAVTSSATYKSIERNKIADLINSIAGQDDGVEYFFRTVGGVHVMQLYGNSITPPPQTNALEYGGNLDGYSVQFNAQSIANDYDVVSSNGRVGNATAPAKTTEYNALYSDVTTGSDLTATTALNNAALKTLKDTQSSKVTPSLTTRVLTPIKDFDFGSQFSVIINDNYVNVNQIIRVVGWQLTVSQGDKLTTVIYTKDTEGVS